MRELRRYEYMAQKEHYCDNCCRHIQPGDFYEGIVYASKNKGIVVFKQHVHPCCEPDPDFERDIEILESLETSENLETKVNLAA